jgi:TetR/AcrR family transcriptional regulator, transcriptional repressor for nem operon
MPPSRKHHNKIRELVLQSAGRLFNRHGFNAVSIDDVMAEAGLTRGSFYCYFASKSDLYAQSVARVVHEGKENPKDSASERTKADQIVRDYLSSGEHEETGDTFPMIGLPNDISRTDRAVRQAFEAALKLMVQSFEQAANGSAHPRRVDALSIAALCVGGMVLSRSIDDRKLADELRSAALNTALELGKW